jgi:hypothetical protein
MSNMLFGIVTAAIAQAPDIVVAGQVGEKDDLTNNVGLTGADAVIVQSDRPDAAESFVSLFRSFPALKVIAIRSDCSSGFLYQLRPQSIRLPELSADLLQSALRARIVVTSQIDWSAVLPLLPAENRSPRLKTVASPASGTGSVTLPEIGSTQPANSGAT